jgi:hypothetical protein
MWVRFQRAFDWTPPEKRLVTMSYPAGHIANVPRDCAEKAIAAGAAVRTVAPPKEQRS